MTPTAFEFTLTMPGDERLVGAIRQLAAQAAGYAQLSTGASQGLATEVERAATAAIASTDAQDAEIEVRFSGDETALKVQISCEAIASAPTPRSTSNNGMSVDWTSDGSRHTCHIRQRIPA
jgi:hypothetical protein